MNLFCSSSSLEGQATSLHMANSLGNHNLTVVRARANMEKAALMGAVAQGSCKRKDCISLELQAS